MRLLLVFFLLQSCFGTALYAQSKKKVNELLLDQLADRKHIQDSILEVHTNLGYSIKKAEKDIFTTGQLLNTKKEEVTSKRAILQHNYELLALLGYDASTIIPYSEITKLEAPTADYGLWTKSAKLFRTFAWSKIDEMPEWGDVKTKAQNKLLVSQILAYDSVNKADKDVLVRERNYLDTLVIMKTDAEKEIAKYNAQIAYMVEKSDAIAIKWQDINRQKEDKEEEEYMKMLKAWEKKQKPGELHFIPPRVYQRSVERPVLSTDVKETEYDNVVVDEFPVSPPKPEPVIIALEVPAEFVGGRAALLNYLEENLVLPESVLKGDISGKCYVKFVVSGEGKISNVIIVRGIADCKECDAEAKRVVEKMPDWKPGENNGKTVSQWYNLPIVFKAPN